MADEPKTASGSKKAAAPKTPETLPEIEAVDALPKEPAPLNPRSVMVRLVERQKLIDARARASK